MFQDLLLEVNQRFNFQTHAFVLMNNHYHLIGTASREYMLSQVMEWFQRSANRRIHRRSGRINHLFGGPYSASLIRNEYYYFHALKYLFRNPIEAGLCNVVEEYEFSSLKSSRIPIATPVTGIEALVPKQRSDFLEIMNKSYSEESKEVVSKAMLRAEISFSARIKKSVRQELSLRGQSQKGTKYF